MEQMLKIKEVAALVRMDAGTVREWCRAGKIPAIRMGERGHYRIPMTAIGEVFNVRGKIA